MDDPDELYAKLDVMGLSTVRERLAQKVWNPRREALVKLWVQRKERELVPGPPPESGMNREAERREWLKQLDQLGVEHVERWSLNQQRAGDPLKTKWTEDWLVEKLIERKVVAEHRLDVQNWWTRGLSIAALILSGIALGLSYYTWSHPQPSLPIILQVPSK
jgi:hypothetical protein